MVKEKKKGEWKMGLSKHLVLRLVAGAGFVASVVLAFKAGRKCDEILEKLDSEGAGKLQKAKAVLKETAPAVGAMAITGLAIGAEITGREKEFKALTAKAEKLKNSKDKAIDSFNKYRNALTEMDGKEKDIKVIEKAAGPLESDLVVDGDDGEQKHRFKLDWLGEGNEIYLDISLAQAIMGMSEINRILNDPDVTRYEKQNGQPKLVYCNHMPNVSDFLKAVDREDLCNSDTDDAGWDSVVLADECHAYWIDYQILKTSDDISAEYEIVPDIYPNYSIKQYKQELKARGRL